MTSKGFSAPQLSALPFALRVALSLLLFILIGGFAASGLHMMEHHENRDERPGVSMDDLRGAYHGVNSRAGLSIALDKGHPGEIDGQEALPKRAQDILVKWLSSDRITEDYDNLDLGDDAPAEILGEFCSDCHSSKSKDKLAKAIPLDYFDDVKKIAFSREIRPVDTKILLASTHTHALALGTLTLLVSMLFFLTRWPAKIRHVLILAASLGLFCDLAAWWVARSSGAFVVVIAIAGAVFAGSVLLMMLGILVDLGRGGSEA